MRTCTPRRLSRLPLLPIGDRFVPRERPEEAALDLPGAHRRAEQESLVFVAMQPAQELELLGGFHALGDHAYAQAAAHGDDGADDRDVLRRGGEITEERAVDLERVDAEVPYVPERGVAGAEVVDRDARAQAREPLEDRTDLLGVAHEQALG